MFSFVFATAIHTNNVEEGISCGIESQTMLILAVLCWKENSHFILRHRCRVHVIEGKNRRKEKGIGIAV